MDWRTHLNCLDPALDILRKLFDELPQNPHWNNHLQAMLLDLRFFKMFVWGLEYCWDDEAGKDLHLLSLIRTIRSELTETLMECGKEAAKYLHLCSYLVERIKQLKPQIRQCCIAFLDGALKCKSSEYEDFYEYARGMVNFLAFILDNLRILSLPVDVNGRLKQQIGFIQEKLMFVGSSVDLYVESVVGGEKLHDFLSYIQTCATHISCLTCIYWIDGVDKSTTCILGHLLSDLMQKTLLIRLHLNLLQAARYVQSKHQPAQFGARYIDFLLGDVDDVEELREGLTFLLSFAMDPHVVEEDSGLLLVSHLDPLIHPPAEDSWLIWTQIDAIISEVPFIICSVHMDEGTPAAKSKLSDCLDKIERVQTEVRKLHVLLSSISNSPKTNAIGFLDFLLGNLKHMLELEVKESFVSSLKPGIEVVRKELEFLRPFLLQLSQSCKNEHEEIKDDLLMQIINIMYNANYAIKLSSLKDVPIWYPTICLSNVIEDIKLIKTEVKNIEDAEVVQSSDDDLPPQQATTSRFEGVFLGFEDDVRTIIDHLVGQRTNLTIISISGMSGQGKTTLAKKIWNDPSIQYHFHRTAWCYVSKECKTRDLLIGVLRSVVNADVVDVGKHNNLEMQDLIEHLWRCLKGRRYLIVMDDIWDVEVWHEVKGSFPDDNNGSRILFTSRNHNLGSQANKQNSISHPLRLFSEEESWELMKQKLYHHFDGFPPEFLEIAKEIAVCCKGLPLAVSLIASLLGRIGQQMDLWNQVSKNLKSHLVNEGCAHIIELSYRYLAEYLKPCFLYFGAFPRGKYIRARKLKLLWIAEGFVEENEAQRPEDLVNQYLEDLVSQSLVVVRQRSSLGGIKTCTVVHDLLYDLCLEKAVEENFLLFTEESICQERSSSRPMCDHYRVCICDFLPDSNPRPISTRKKPLIISQVHSLRCFNHFYYFRLEVEALMSFKVLTVLDLEYVLLDYCFHIPDALLSLVHLRYLAMYAAIKVIQPSIVSLWNLETFIIKGAKMGVKLPETIFNIKTLRHVNIDGSCVIYYDDSEEEGAPKSCDIERLSSPIIFCDSKSEKLLRGLPKIRKLKCYFGEQFHPRHGIWLSIFRPLTMLEVLRIDFRGYKTWFNGSSSESFAGFDFPNNLKKLTLSGLKLPWSAMSTIGKMPNLEVLKLERAACKGLKWDLEDEQFPSLRYLKLCELDIEQIDVSGCDDNSPFPLLEELVVDSCEKLEEIPSSFGEICTLKSITVFGWYSVKAKLSAMRILKEQRELGNDGLQVFIAFGSGDDDDGTDIWKAVEKRFQRHLAVANIFTSAEASAKLLDLDDLH